MISIDLKNSNSWTKASAGQAFVLLGKEQNTAPTQAATDRLHGASLAAASDLWATLGPWKDSAAPSWQGVLHLSQQGNDASHAVESGLPTITLLNHVQSARGTGADVAVPVRERFIDLSDLELPDFPASFSLEDEPSLRLTVFVRSDEGAIVTVQHGRYGEQGFDFVQPQPTPGFSCSRRDRLTYRIPVTFATQGRARPIGNMDGDAAINPQLEADGDVAKISPGTSIKVLTFQRANSPSQQVIARALEKIGGTKYALQKWDRGARRFVSVAPAQVQLGVKTLLLLHGTFSSTTGSYTPLAQPDPLLGGDSWLSTISREGARYGQVLAFDHDTILDGLEANAARLRQCLGGDFTGPVDIVTHSRGGLLGKHLAIAQPGLQVERAAMTACANGVGYFNAARGLSRLLSVLYHLLRGTPSASLVVALLQHSIDVVRTLDGLKIMDPKSEELRQLVQAPVPEGRAQTTFLPIVGDFTKAVVSGDEFFKRLALRGLDELIKTMLGPAHDWVVGTAQQRVVCPGRTLPGFEPAPVPTYHTTYYGHPGVRNRAMQFLSLGT